MLTAKPLDTDLRESIERESTTLSISEIVGYLQAHLDQKITAYLAGLDNAKTLGLWISGNEAPSHPQETRLRYAYQAARLIREPCDDETAKAWFFGSNSLLDDEAPAYVLRHRSTPAHLRLFILAVNNLVAGVR